MLIHTLFIHVRGLPMFATLLGFGVGLLTMSLWRRGLPPGAAKRTLWRRYAVLGAFGAIHLVVLFFGDIILTYSLIAMVLIAMLTLRDRALLIIARVLLGIHITFMLIGGLAVGFFPGLNDMLSGEGLLPETDSYPAYVLNNLLMLCYSLLSAPVTLLMLLPLMIIGFVWARQDVLNDIAAHRRRLQIWVGIAVGVIVLVGLPWGLSALGVLPQRWEAPLMIINNGVGVLTGPGILALVLLLFRGTEEQLRPWLRPFVALGRRSMSGYMLQSLLFLLLTQSFTLGWGRGADIPTQMGIALGIWGVTLLWAWVWDLLGWPGPVEQLHRRLSYGRAGRPATWQGDGTPAPAEELHRVRN